MFAKATFILDLWSNIWPKMLIFRDMAKKLIFREARHKILMIFGYLGQEGPRNFSDTAKCSQWPHLYTTYEATYDLKCLFVELWPKIWFFLCATSQNTNYFRYFELLFWAREVQRTFQIRWNLINGHTYTWIIKQLMPFSRLFMRYTRNTVWFICHVRASTSAQTWLEIHTKRPGKHAARSLTFVNEKSRVQKDILTRYQVRPIDWVIWYKVMLIIRNEYECVGENWPPFRKFVATVLLCSPTTRWRFGER